MFLIISPLHCALPPIGGCSELEAKSNYSTCWRLRVRTSGTSLAREQDTLSRSSMENAINIYISVYIYIHIDTRYLTLVAQALHNVGGVKCQPFLQQ